MFFVTKLLIGLGLTTNGWTGELNYNNRYGLAYDSVSYKEEKYERYTAFVQPALVGKSGVSLVAGYKLGLESHLNSTYYNRAYIIGVPRVGVISNIRNSPLRISLLLELGKEFDTISNDRIAPIGPRIESKSSIVFSVYTLLGTPKREEIIYVKCREHENCR